MQGMRLSEVELVRLLPLFMREDGAARGIGAGVDEFAKDLIQYSPLLKKWDQIDNMDHQHLDELAWELNVLWYDAGASLEAKRRLIKNSDKVYSRLGTKWAVEEVVATYLGDATVMEFWEYDGRPHYFKIASNNPQITTDMEKTFLWALEIVKRKSQWLDAITIELQSSAESFSGAAVHDVSVDTVRIVRYAEDMNPPPSVAYAAPAWHDTAVETVRATRYLSDMNPPDTVANTAAAVQDAAVETVRIGRDFPELDPPPVASPSGAGYVETTIETHSMKGGES